MPADRTSRFGRLPTQEKTEAHKPQEVQQQESLQWRWRADSAVFAPADAVTLMAHASASRSIHDCLAISSYSGGGTLDNEASGETWQHILNGHHEATSDERVLHRIPRRPLWEAGDLGGPELLARPSGLGFAAVALHGGSMVESQTYNEPSLEGHFRSTARSGLLPNSSFGVVHFRPPSGRIRNPQLAESEGDREAADPDLTGFADRYRGFGPMQRGTSLSKWVQQRREF